MAMFEYPNLGELSEGLVSVKIDEAEIYVGMASVHLDSSAHLARCVDGRYKISKGVPVIAKAGADSGDVMILFGALNLLGKSLPNETVLQIVVDTVGGAQNFSWHTDDHADPAQPGMGCGHLSQALKDATAYGLNDEQMKFVMSQLPVLLQQGAHEEVLHGDHQETAVLDVTSDSYGLRAQVSVGDKLWSVFSYHRTLHEAQLKHYAEVVTSKLNEVGESVTLDEVAQAIAKARDLQLGETVKRLAGNLPKYSVNISSSGETSVVEL